MARTASKKVPSRNANRTAGKDAIALLKADHRKVEGLFERYEKSNSKAAKAKLAQQICLELSVHTTIEEELFYPAVQGTVDEEIHDEAYVEHDGAKVLIAELRRDARRRILRCEGEGALGDDQAPREGRGAAERVVRPGPPRSCRLRRTRSQYESAQGSIG